MRLHRGVALFSALALCFAITSYFRFPILAAIASLPQGSEHVERLETVDAASPEPIRLASFPASHSQRVKLAFEFCANSVGGVQKLAQTADGDRGVRVELVGPRLVAVFPGRVHEVTRKVLFDQVQPGQWYDVSVEFQSSLYVQAQTTAGKSIRETRVRPIECDSVVVARGFSDAAPFNGQIRKVSIQATPNLGFWRGEAIYLGLKLAILLLGGAMLWGMARSGSFKTPKPVPLVPPLAAGPIDPLLTLRAFALLQVFIGHLFWCIFVPEGFVERLKEDAWLRVLTPAPWIGVWVFFTLSGYLMGKGYYSGRYTLSPESVSHFLSNRFLRIVPVYATAVLAVAVVLHPELFALEHVAVLGSILLFDYAGMERLNPIGCLWSISTEVQFYALAPLLFWGLARLVGERHHRAFVGVGAVLVAGLVTRLLIKVVVGREGVNRYIYAPLLANLDMFLLGMLANPAIAALRSRAWVSRFATIPSLIWFLGVGYLVSAYFGARTFTRETDVQRLMIYGPTFVALFTLIAIVCCELGSRAQAKTGLARRVLLVGQSIGVLSYVLYVWHEPILVSIRRLAPTPLSLGDAMKFGLAAAFVTWAVAELVYRTIELPTARLKRKSLADGGGSQEGEALAGGRFDPASPATVFLPSSTPAPTARPSSSKAA